MSGFANLPSPLVESRDERLAPHDVHLRLKRDDLVNPEIPGNKWRKLKENLQAARDQGVLQTSDLRRRVLQPHPRNRRCRPCCATGTGGTLARIAAGLSGPQRALGFAVLKGGEFLEDEVRRLQQEAYGTATTNWSVDTDFHFGGYTKRTSALDSFIAGFNERHGVTPDWVYEAKMLYGLFARSRPAPSLGVLESSRY